MDIYKYALQMELDGRHFYLDMMKKTNNKGLKNILTMLADSEAKHYNVILDMQKNDKTEFSADTEVLTNVKNIFVKMKEEKDPHRKEIFLKLAEEEKNHCVLLENIIGFVSQPADWLENPEWYHLDE